MICELQRLTLFSQTRMSFNIATLYRVAEKENRLKMQLLIFLLSQFMSLTITMLLETVRLYSIIISELKNNFLSCILYCTYI